MWTNPIGDLIASIKAIGASRSKDNIALFDIVWMVIREVFTVAAFSIAFAAIVVAMIALGVLAYGLKYAGIPDDGLIGSVLALYVTIWPLLVLAAYAVGLVGESLAKTSPISTTPKI